MFEQIAGKFKRGLRFLCALYLNCSELIRSEVSYPVIRLHETLSLKRTHIALLACSEQTAVRKIIIREVVVLTFVVDVGDGRSSEIRRTENKIHIRE